MTVGQVAAPAVTHRCLNLLLQDYLVDTAVLKQQLEVARSRLTRKALQDSIDDGTIPVGLGQEGEGLFPYWAAVNRPNVHLDTALQFASQACLVSYP